MNKSGELRMNIDRRLLYISFVAFVIYVLYLFFGPSYVSYPLPTYTEEEALEAIQEEVKKLGLEPITKENLEYSDIIANSSIGRYIDHKKLTEDELKELQKEVTIQSFEISSYDLTYSYDMERNRLTKAENIILVQDADQFVREYFGKQYELKGKDTELKDEPLAFGDSKKTYVAPTKFPEIINVVDIYLIGETIVAFEQYGLARGFPEVGTTLFEIITSLFGLLILLGLVVFATIHLIIKLFKKQIEFSWGPLLLTAAAGIGWVFISIGLGGSLTFFNLIEPAIMIYLTFVTLVIRWKRSTRTIKDRLRDLQPSVIHGFSLMIIAIVLAEAFFYVASFFDTWASPVTTYMLLVKLDVWMIPIFTLFIGLSAAVTEESVFRNYLIPIFDRVGILFSLIMTSFLWGVLHIGYDMYPWYLYVLEFLIVTGPLFYFVYKRYGFSAAIFLHYFYNAWVTTLFLFIVDIKVAIVSLFVMLSPFLLFLIRKKDSPLQSVFHK